MTRKLGKKNDFEQGTFYAYACDCGCVGAVCGACTNCNSKNAESSVKSAVNVVANDKIKNIGYGGIFLA